MHMLADAHIFYRLIETFGRDGFIWQQDNAPAHGPAWDVIRHQFEILVWPPHSPDLSPIEMLWAIIKRTLRGRRFASADELFNETVKAWDEIPQSVIDNLCSSFAARCSVCIDIGGKALNGHWRAVHKVHHEMHPEHVPVEPTSVDDHAENED
jgi:hypothetical protein